MKTLIVMGMLALLFLAAAIFSGIAHALKWNLGDFAHIPFAAVALESIAVLICILGFCVELNDYKKRRKAEKL